VFVYYPVLAGSLVVPVELDSTVVDVVVVLTDYALEASVYPDD
jgi:hypothetical protein